MQCTVSFKSRLENSKEDYDYVDFDLVHKIPLVDIELEPLNDAQEIKAIKFSFKMEDNKLYIIGKLDNYDDVKYELELQQFTDSLANSIYDNLDVFDDSEYIKEYKDKIVKKFSELLFNDNILCTSGQYKCFGYIYKNNDKIGTIDDIEIISKNNIKLIDYQSLIELKDCAAEIYITNKKYKFNIEDINEANITNINNFAFDKEEELDKEIKMKEEYSDYDEYLLARRNLISNNINNDEDIDIDFDF